MSSAGAALRFSLEVRMQRIEHVAHLGEESVVVRESLLQAAQRFGWNGAKA